MADRWLCGGGVSTEGLRGDRDVHEGRGGHDRDVSLTLGLPWCNWARCCSSAARSAVGGRAGDGGLPRLAHESTANARQQLRGGPACMVCFAARDTRVSLLRERLIALSPVFFTAAAISPTAHEFDEARAITDECALLVETGLFKRAAARVTGLGARRPAVRRQQQAERRHGGQHRPAR